MSRLVKICGLTRPEDARLAAELGATHVGAILAPGSPRRVSAERARQVLEAAGSRATPVLVFRRAGAALVLRQALRAGVRHVQLYDCSADAALRLERAGLIVYRVYTVAADATALSGFALEPSPDRPAVLDTDGGGSGRTFRWELLAPRAPYATFIAGGINPDNVQRLLEHEPYGLDLSSGVESAPGIKDPARLERFFRRLADGP